MSTPDRIERFADWAVGVISPRKGHIRSAYRAHFRLMESDYGYRETLFALMSARGYRAANPSGIGTQWRGTNRSADGEILTDIDMLCNKTRELNRDDPLASGLTETFVKNVIGTGMRPQARTKDKDTNDAIEAVFSARKHDLSRADDMTHGEQQRMKLAKVLEDGEVFVKRTQADADDPVWFETIERDRVATPLSANAEDPQGSIRAGVEKNAAGVPVAYWVRKAHPGDAVSRVGLTSNDFDRVLKSEICHLRLANRPGQSHGVPQFHAIVQDLRDLDLLILASLKRVQIAACLAVFIKTSESIEDIVDVTAQKHGYKLDQELEPGMMFKLGPTEEIQTLIPNFPIPELEPFIIMLARRIGAALGVSWQIVLKDFSDSTYSSARTDLLEARMTYVVLQSWFIEKYLNWEWESVLEDAMLRGELPGVTFDEIKQVTWIPNGWRWVDPKKEAEATEVELRMGTTTLRDVCASQGKDWEEVMEQRIREEAREAELRAEYNLPPKVVAAPPKPSADKDDDEDEDRSRMTLTMKRSA
ncbi:MAG TPA: phage portal protein [Pirellulales bacterium]|nr:phage portal protein [Pirellulales bacterium]